MNMQIPAERAFGIPLELSRRLGFFDMPSLARLSQEQCREAMLRPSPLHRFEYMGDRLYSAIQRIHNVYGDNASRIWAGAPSSSTIERRFHDFDGAGPKIASMATNILARSFSIPMSDRSGIDISVDSHLLRVFPRLGFAEEGANAETLRSAARALNPEYPGIFDVALWDLGRTVCGPRNPNCPACELRDVCPTGTGIRPAQPSLAASTARQEPAPRAAARTESPPRATRASAPSPSLTPGAVDLLFEIKAEVEAASPGWTCLPPERLGHYHERYGALLQCGFAADPPPAVPPPTRPGRKAQSPQKNPLDRLSTYRSETIAFMGDFRVPFDNNLAERDLRMMKVKQKILGTFRTRRGAETFCAIRSYLSTARKQGQAALGAINDA